MSRHLAYLAIGQTFCSFLKRRRFANVCRRPLWSEGATGMRHRWIALIVVLLLVGRVGSVDAGVIVFWTGNNAFDDQTITFTPFLADRLTSISGTGFSDNAGNLGVVFDLSVSI